MRIVQHQLRVIIHRQSIGQFYQLVSFFFHRRINENLIVFCFWFEIGSANVPSPDDEITSLVKYLKENLSRIQSYIQKFTNEKNIDKVRHVHQIHQQMVQFITNPTMENINSARHIRDLLERSMVKQKYNILFHIFIYKTSIESSITTITTTTATAAPAATTTTAATAAKSDNSTSQ